MTRLSCIIKDPFPGLSHWLGVVLSIAGLIALLSVAEGRLWHVIAFAIYGTSLVLLYLASALVHTIHCPKHVEDRLERFDFIAIFLLIAGTYTPLCLVNLRGPWGWGMLAAEWGMAAVGIAATVMGGGGSRRVRTLLYAVMAWIVALVAIHPITRAISPAGLAWLLAGGVVYSVGAVIFATNRPNLWPGRFVAHDLWHVLVLAGSACHFIMIFRFVGGA